MKKLVYLLSSLMLVFTACDPMEDVYEELDKAKTTDKTTVATTLVKADYEVYKSDATVPHVAKSQYFTNEAEAAALIPAILNKKYAHLGNGATVTTNYNRLKYPTVSNTVSSWMKYTVTAEDYTTNGESNPNFNSSGDVFKFLGTKYPTPAERQLVVLTYDYYNGSSTSTITDSYLYVNGRWEDIYHVSVDNYTATGNGKFKNFDSNSDAYLESYFNQFLLKSMVAKPGKIEFVSYTYYSGTTSQRVMAMIYDGSKWSKVVGVVETASLKFKKKENVWEPDLSIPYSLVSADYTWIGDNPALGTESNRANLKQFGNFYQSNPNSSNYWSDDQIAAAMAALLKNLFPNAEVGQKYQVSFIAYRGSNTTVSLIFIKNAAGGYDLYVE